MSKEITFQFLWSSAVRAMAFGSHRIIPLNIAERAWPATGQNEVMQIALVVGGHQPEPTRVTVEHIQDEFSDDPSFVVTQDASFGNIHIERRLESCPYCHGCGVAVVNDNGFVPVQELVDCGWAPGAHQSRQECTHMPGASGPGHDAVADFDCSAVLDDPDRLFV